MNASLSKAALKFWFSSQEVYYFFSISWQITPLGPWPLGKWEWKETCLAGKFTLPGRLPDNAFFKPWLAIDQNMAWNKKNWKCIISCHIVKYLRKHYTDILTMWIIQLSGKKRIQLKRIKRKAWKYMIFCSTVKYVRKHVDILSMWNYTLSFQEKIQLKINWKASMKIYDFL